MPVSDVWPFRIESGSVDVLEYYTDVLKTYSTEQRIRLREFPRQSFRYRHLFDEAQFARASLLLRGLSYINDIYVPIWSEATQLKATVNASDTVLNFDTQSANYTDFLMVWQDDNTFATCAISSVTPTSITLDTNVGVNIQEAVVVPLRNCYVSGQISQGIFNMNYYLDVTFNVRDNDNPSITPAETYNSIPVYPYPLYNTQALSNLMNRSVQYFDSGLGLVEIEPVEDLTRGTRQLTFFYQTKQQKWEIRNFIGYLSGKLKPFYLPTYLKDLIPLTNSTTSIVVAQNALGIAYFNRAIRVQQKNGTVYYNKITNVTNSGGNYVLSLASSFPASVGPTNTEKISFMDLVRSDTDTFEFPVDASVKGSISFPTKEIRE